MVAAFLVLIVASALPSRVAAAPITFNTALPVAEGEGIVRLQGKWIHATGDSSVLERELDVFAAPLVGVYGVSDKLALFAIVPILDKSLEVNTAEGRRERPTSGLGDVTLLGRYTVVKRDRPGRTFRLAPFLGIEAPTGEDNGSDALGRLPPGLQLGSGSWDFTVGSVATWQTLDWQFDASLAYRNNTEANGFAFGDEARLDLSYQRRILPRTLGGGVPRFLYGVLESNLVWQDRDRTHGVDAPDSGGFTWFLAPGIQSVGRRWVVETAVQVPVVQSLHGNALESDFILTLSTRVNF
jgi:hypothetical protein